MHHVQLSEQESESRSIPYGVERRVAIDLEPNPGRSFHKPFCEEAESGVRATHPRRKGREPNCLVCVVFRPFQSLRPIGLFASGLKGRQQRIGLLLSFCERNTVKQGSFFSKC